MKLQTLILTLLALLWPGSAGAGDALAIRVGRAETASHGTIENAVVMVEDGKIVVVGEDLPVERGIPILDRPDGVAMPGLVSAYTRLGLDGRAGVEFSPHVVPRPEILPRNTAWGDVLEFGVTTLGLYPTGSSIAGQAVCIRPKGETTADMLVSTGAYLKMTFAANAKSKKALAEAFERVDKYAEQLEKAREKYDKEVEKAKKKKKSKSKKDDDDDEKKGDDDEKGGDDDEDEKKDEKEADAKGDEIGPFVPPEKPPEVQAFEDVRAQELQMLFAIGKSVEYLRLIEALADEDVDWALRIRATTYLDIFHVADKIGEHEPWVLIEPQITMYPGTMRQRNIPRELAAAGARIVFVPTASDSLSRHESWRVDVGRMIAAGLDRDLALKAMTLHPAEFLGLGDRLGSLDAGKDANMIFLTGDPFEPATRVEAVMLEGEFVFGEVNL